MKTIQNKLGTYLAITAGVGCAASTTHAAVTFYGINSANDTNADPNGIRFADFFGMSSYVGGSESYPIYFSSGSDQIFFTRGEDLTSVDNWWSATYLTNGSLSNGASVGDQNYANISFDSRDGVPEAVAQFYFDEQGSSYLIAIATTNASPDPQDLSGVGGAALSISSGKAMIDAAAVPEPSSLALLALGASGLVTRRNRKKAA